MHSKNIFIYILVFFLSLSSFPMKAQTPNLPPRLEIWQDTLYGLIDDKGTVVVPCEYEEINLLNRDAFIIAKRQGLWGILDWDGRQLVPFIYDLRPEFIPHTKDLFIISQNGRAGGVINSKGDTILPFQYLDLREVVPYYDVIVDPVLLVFTLGEMRDGKMHFRKGRHLEGCVDLNGNVVIPPIYRSISFWSKGLIVTDTNDREGLMDFSGHWIYPLNSQYRLESYYSDFNVSIIDKNTKLEGLLNDDGTIALPILYRHILPSFFNQVLLQDTAGLWAMADSNYHLLTPHRYKELFNLSELDVSDYYVGVLPDESSEVLDTLGHVLTFDPPLHFKDNTPYEYPLFFEDSVWRLITPSGKVLPERYSEASHFWSSTLMSVATDSLHAGIVDLNGRVVVPLRYLTASADEDRFILARRKSGKVDVFSGTGKRLCSCWGADCSEWTLQVANRKGKWALMDEEGHRMSRYYAESLLRHTSDGSCFWAVYDGKDKIVYLNEKGHEIYSWQIDVSELSEDDPSPLRLMIPHDCSCGELIYDYVSKR
ncbi:MAG: WG repeat-containing protein [Bacteroidales bacterium]|nr:WG repeat-containing protein [Bacteroidales bacterium]